jgi:hypothetical protein
MTSFADSTKRLVLPPSSGPLQCDVEVGIDEGSALKVVRREDSPYVSIYSIVRHDAQSRWLVECGSGICFPAVRIDALATSLRVAEGYGGQLVQRVRTLGEPIDRVLEAFEAGEITKARARELIEAGIVWGAKDIENGLPTKGGG